MPRPSQVHQNKALENISIAYMPQGLVAPDVSPVVPVNFESDSYYVYSKDNLRVLSTIWGDGDVPNQSAWSLSTSTYSLTRHALRDLVTDRMEANADKAIKPQIDMTEGLTGQLRLRMEMDLFTLINTEANWANETSLSSTQAWSQNTTLSNPISFVDSASTSIRSRSGLKPNTIVMGDGTFKAAKEHTSIVDRIKYTSAQSVTPEILAALFNVEKVAVSGAVRNSADEGQVDALVDLATDTAFVCYVERNPGLKKPSTFYTFMKEGNTTPFKVRTYRDEEREGTWIEVSNFYQHRIVSTDTAYNIVNTL
jgi:hypothetical protein